MRHISSTVVFAFAFVTSTLALANDRASTKQAAGDQRELHVVSIYQGANKTDGKIHGGKAAVKIDRPNKLVTLVLSSYEPVTWEVSVAPKSQVSRVILGGYHRQAVKGLPEQVEVVEAFYEGGNAKNRLYGSHSIDSGRFRPMVQAINGLTGLEISSFQGKYAYDSSAPFVIDRVQADAKLSSDYPKPTPATDLPKLEFKALHLTATDRHHLGAAFGDFTLAGPKLDSLKPIPRGVTRLAVDTDSKKFYGLTGHDVVEIDLEKQVTTKLDLGLDVPRLSWPCGITFDTKRQRLIVITLGGSGYMYSYSPKSGKWSVLSDMNNLDLSGLVYHPKEDALYGLSQERGEDGDGGVPTLYQFNAEGALVKTMRLGEPMFPGVLGRSSPIDAPPQMVIADGQLVIVALAGGGYDSEQTESNRFMFLVDPKSGKILLTWKN